jgi:hypothetical protein
MEEYWRGIGGVELSHSNQVLPRAPDMREIYQRKSVFSSPNQSVASVLACVDTCENIATRINRVKQLRLDIGGLRYTASVDATPCVDDGSAVRKIADCGNKHSLHGRQHSRPISGAMPALPRPSHCSGLRPAHRTPEGSVWRPNRQRAEAEGLRAVHPGTIREEGRGSARTAASGPVGGFHASGLVLVPHRSQRPARREAAQAPTSRSADCRRRILGMPCRRTPTRSAHDGSGPMPRPAPGRPAQPEVVRHQERRAPRLPVKDRKAAGNRTHARCEAHLRQVLDAAESRRVRRHEEDGREVFERGLQGIVAAHDQCLCEARRSPVHVPRHPRDVRNEVRDARNRPAAAGPFEHQHDAPDLPEGHRASESSPGADHARHDAANCREALAVQIPWWRFRAAPVWNRRIRLTDDNGEAK